MATWGFHQKVSQRPTFPIFKNLQKFLFFLLTTNLSFYEGLKLNKNIFLEVWHHFLIHNMQHSTQQNVLFFFQTLL